jgi:hypothetical protein
MVRLVGRSVAGRSKMERYSGLTAALNRAGRTAAIVFLMRPIEIS